MEQILNTVSKSKVDQFDENSAVFSMNVDFQKNTEQVDDEFLELNPLSVDQVEFLEAKTRKNGVDGFEGDLLVNHTKDVNFQVDIDGSLHISDYNEDKYEINEMGELIINL